MGGVVTKEYTIRNEERDIYYYTSIKTSDSVSLRSLAVYTKTYVNIK